MKLIILRAGKLWPIRISLTDLQIVTELLIGKAGTHDSGFTNFCFNIYLSKGKVGDRVVRLIEIEEFQQPQLRMDGIVLCE